LSWKADPFEAKWSILARSYRFLHEEKVSLDKFLELCVPLIGVIHQDIYSSVVGWELGESNGQKRSEPSSQGVNNVLATCKNRPPTLAHYMYLHGVIGFMYAYGSIYINSLRSYLSIN
jgi:hypothetical protein